MYFIKLRVQQILSICRLNPLLVCLLLKLSAGDHESGIYDYSSSSSTGTSGKSGIIELKNYLNNENRQWDVNADCDEVRIISTQFETEECCDHVTIAISQYSGESIVVNHTVGSSFSVKFTSDGSVTHNGFVLEWSCNVVPGRGSTTEGYNKPISITRPLTTGGSNGMTYHPC